MRPIQSAAVLGAGTMGSQLAAHLANAGLPVVLLDVTADAARQGVERLKTLKPDPLFVPDGSRLIGTGSLDDLTVVSNVDWIVEAIVERLDVKQALLAAIEPYRAANAIVSSNTSAISIAALASGRSPEFRAHFLGTHFFNPPRYLRLVEIVPTADTDASVVAHVEQFIDERLGKGTVIAKDSPGFIANHLGLLGVVHLLHAAASGDYTIEEIDAITGPAIGRPKSATFRTIDIAGLDILAHVASDLAERLPREEDRRAFNLPPFVQAMLDRGLLGEKSGRGFYKRVKQDGDSTILTLDLDVLGGLKPAPTSDSALKAAPTSDGDVYRERKPPHLLALDAAQSITDSRQRLQTLFLGNDRAGALLRKTLTPVLVHAARVATEIAESIDDVDRAMRWGFGWDLGPFEMWDAIGVKNVIETSATSDIPPLARRLHDAGRETFRDAPLGPAKPGLLILQAAKQRSRIVKQNAGASLVDLGDEVVCVELHSKMNTIGGDAIEMIHAGVDEAATNFRALVVGSEAEHFSAGANLMLLLLEAQEGNWDEIDAMVRAFQGATMALKTSPAPVVAAPAGLALGGGCEICLHADRVQAAAESYIGLVEVGVGLIPAGGGTKEMLLRAVDRSAGADPSPHVQAAFETIGFGKVSTSGLHAKRLGYLRDVDAITMNRERLLNDAKTDALARVADGYQPPVRRTTVPVGGADTRATLSLGVHLAWRAGRISDHDALIGRKLAWILAGGDLPHRATVHEDYLLDLEREAFLSLCGEEKTLERIGYTLKTGKTLRN